MNEFDGVSIRLPPADAAPAYLDSLRTFFEFEVEMFGPDSVAVRPAEGAGVVRPYFKAHRLCDGTTKIDDSTWQPLREHPSLKDRDQDRKARLMQAAEEFAARPPNDLPAQLSGLAARIFTLTDEELPDFLSTQMPILFEGLPDASLWFVSVDPVLTNRLGFQRTQTALELTPDLPMNPDEFESLRGLMGHSLSKGIDFGWVLNPLLLAFSPGVAGYGMTRFPHALIFLFGHLDELRVEPTATLPQIYEPRVLHAPEPRWDDEEFRRDLTRAEFEELIPWWVDQLNVIYSHAIDPTRWERLGSYEPVRPTSWLLTMERLLADGIQILAHPSGPMLVRNQQAFDLLDKAEVLLGFTGKGDSGKGFKALLRKSTVLPALGKAWSRMPEGPRQRFTGHAGRAYDAFYERIRENAMQFRLTKNGVTVARTRADELHTMATQDYAAELTREVRNSAHGLISQMELGKRFLLATHDGELPSAFGDLATLMMFGLVGNAAGLVRGDWLS